MEYLCSRWADEKLYKGKVQPTRLKYDIYIWPYSEKRKTSETKNARLACPFRYQYGSIRRICRLPWATQTRSNITGSMNFFI